MTVSDHWTEILRCPDCALTGVAVLSQPKGSESVFFEELPAGFQGGIHEIWRHLLLRGMQPSGERDERLSRRAIEVGNTHRPAPGARVWGGAIAWGQGFHGCDAKSANVKP